MRIFSELPMEGTAVHRIGGKDLCDLLNLTSGALTDLKKREIAVHLGRDSYDLEETVRRYVTHLRSTAARWGDPEQVPQLTAEKARLAKEQADAQALKNAKMRGELVEASEVENTWADVLRQLRARLLAIPSRLRADLPGLDAATVAAIDRALRDTLSEIAADDHA
ncbi:terminase small subunit [Histidinibacterium lentulum]|uniref:DNA packaging protein n=1 Tax=Histidinibacterium lentulum TaxID=2480588 RepID=A0A3N2QV72_9RHOB|nr:terminase small subunit [Histidinibacterium lentulum]ROT99072.1 DNA packaging protein [Histidinibacterium lentulum]